LRNHIEKLKKTENDLIKRKKRRQIFHKGRFGANFLRKLTRYKHGRLIGRCREEMCEFKLILEKEVEFENVVYAKSVENRVVVKDVLGKSREFKNCKITEVDVNNERLVLSPMRPQG
jgi:predicted RNA-binding protein